MQAFIAFTAQKFGIYKNTSYLCNVKGTYFSKAPVGPASKAIKAEFLFVVILWLQKCKGMKKFGKQFPF